MTHYDPIIKEIQKLESSWKSEYEKTQSKSLKPLIEETQKKINELENKVLFSKLSSEKNPKVWIDGIQFQRFFRDKNIGGGKNFHRYQELRELFKTIYLSIPYDYFSENEKINGEFFTTIIFKEPINAFDLIRKHNFEISGGLSRIIEITDPGSYYSLEEEGLEDFYADIKKHLNFKNNILTFNSINGKGNMLHFPKELEKYDYELKGMINQPSEKIEEYISNESKKWI